MQGSYDCESERDTMETSNNGTFWPSSMLASHVVAKKSKFGFELILPNFKQGSLEVEGSQQPGFFSPHLSSKQAPDYQQADRSADSNIDFDSLDRLFSKLNSFDGKFTGHKRYGLHEGDSNLEKRPPVIKTRQRREADSRDSSTINTTYSRLYDGASESEDTPFNKLGRPRKERGTRTRGRGRNIPTTIVLPKRPADKIIPRRRGYHQNTLERGKPSRVNNAEEERGTVSEFTFVEFVKQIVFNDELNSETFKRLSEKEQEIVLKIVRLRYKGAENLKFPLKIKNFASYNTRCNLRFVNEKKLLGEVWPLIIDQLKKVRNLWRTDKDQEIIQLFKTYHRSLYIQEIKKKVDRSLSEQLDEGNDVLIINLFAELYLGYRQ